MKCSSVNDRDFDLPAEALATLMGGSERTMWKLSVRILLLGYRSSPSAMNPTCDRCDAMDRHYEMDETARNG